MPERRRRHKLEPYRCYRCGYNTRHKCSMANHLYKKLKPCMPLRNRIELTEEIKQEILANRVYTPDAEQTTGAGVDQQTPSVHDLQTILRDESFIEKFLMLCQNRDAVLRYLNELPVQEEEEPARFTPRLIHIEFPSIENLTVIYNHTADLFTIDSGGRSREYMMGDGLSYIMGRIVEAFLVPYEYELVRGLEVASDEEVTELIGSLRHYYRILAAFGVKAAVINRPDAVIRGEDANATATFTLSTKYGDMYRDIDRGMERKEKRQLIKTLLRVVRLQADVNEKAIYRAVVDLIRADHDLIRLIAPPMLAA